MDLAAVLTALYPDARWGVTDNDYETLSWDESNAEPKPPLAELEVAWPQVRDARKWADIRAERDGLLAASDWTQMPDSPLDADGKQAWADYRQALRDIPQDYASPDDVVWPETP